MGVTPYIKLKLGSGPTFEIAIILCTRCSKECMWCAAKHLVVG